MDPAASRLVLPVVAGPPPVTTVPQLVPVPGAIGRPDPENARWVIERDVYGRETRVVVTMRTVTDLGGGSQATYADRVCAGVDPERPGHAYVDSMADEEIVWPEVTARAVAHLVLRSDETTYRFDLTLDVFEDGRPLATRRWQMRDAARAAVTAVRRPRRRRSARGSGSAAARRRGSCGCASDASGRGSASRSRCGPAR